MRNIGIFIFFFLYYVSGLSQNVSTSILHLEGIADNRLIASNEDISEQIVNGANSAFVQGFSRRTTAFFTLNINDKLQYVIGLDHHSKSVQHKFKTDPLFDRPAFFPDQYNGAEKVTFLYKDKYFSLPFGIRYFRTLDKKYNLYAGSYLKPAYYYQSVTVIKGVKENGERVHYDRNVGLESINRPFNLAMEIGVGCEINYSQKIRFVVDFNFDHSMLSTRKRDRNYLERWHTINAGLGLSYVFNAHCSK